MRVYIAGPMRGMPDLNLPAFEQAAQELKKHGYETVSPADLIEEQPRSREYYLAKGLAEITKCDEVVFLPGWQQSEGALIEYEFAKKLGKPVRQYQHGTLLPINDNITHTEKPTDQPNNTPDETRYKDPNTGGEKGVKPQFYHLLPWDIIHTEDTYVYYKGAQKYEPRNWERGYPYSISFAALMRHLILWWQYREQRDPETGAHHLACVRFHAAALMRFERQYPELDDRPVLDRPDRPDQ